MYITVYHECSLPLSHICIQQLLQACRDRYIIMHYIMAKQKISVLSKVWEQEI